MQDKNLNQISFKRECYRKLTHLGALSIPGGYYILGLYRNEALAILIPITLAMIIIDIARLRNWPLWDRLRPLIGPIIREHEMKGDFTGATYILTTACLTIGLFPKPVAIAALAFIIFGDPAAALIGRKYGRCRFRGKSLEGSLAFLAMATLVAVVIPQLDFTIGMIGAVVAAVTEAVSYGIDDNASVPLVSGLAMYLVSVAIL